MQGPHLRLQLHNRAVRHLDLVRDLPEIGPEEVYLNCHSFYLAFKSHPRTLSSSKNLGSRWLLTGRRHTLAMVGPPRTGIALREGHRSGILFHGIYLRDIGLLMSPHSREAAEADCIFL
ncbi:hypothetical protein NDU88_000304 [Pleurodeles waltl]|uniref:Uncharacterized protein n=1 Tax=Pleurodeles waltl TaxID=8319 RepID=A0AAV7S881_PLEWA|nr:hypothetical protein NDU88_000304 [Pleurodeles waltl]